MWILNKRRDCMINTDHVSGIYISERFSEITARITTGVGEKGERTELLGSYENAAIAEKVFIALMVRLDTDRITGPNVFYMPRNEEVK